MSVDATVEGGGDASDPRLRFVYAPELAAFELAPSHPFVPLRLELVRTLLEDAGMLLEEERLAPTPLPEKALLDVHGAAYVRAVKAASTGEEADDLYVYGLGTGDNPVFAGMHEIMLGICAATVTAVEAVCSGEALRAANFSGGLHHAMRDKASGFCVYNDLALGIRHATTQHGKRVAYIDVDAHHGDGVQASFYEDPMVMTISLHESGRYLFPGTGHTYETGRDAGRGTAVNVPLEPFTEDASFLSAFDRVVPRALEVFAPDLIVLQAGADMHHRDPLADLCLGLDGMAATYRRVVALADRFTHGRLVVTGGGGYDPYSTVPRAWARAWEALSGRPMPETLPQRWHDRWRALAPTALPTTASEDAQPAVPATRRSLVSSHNEAVVTRLMGNLEDIWGDVLARS